MIMAVGSDSFTLTQSLTGSYRCKACGKEKPLTKEFWFQKISRGKRSWAYSACRECQNVARRESCRDYARQRRTTEDGRASARNAGRKWKARNPDKVYEQHYLENLRKAERAGREYKPLWMRLGLNSQEKKIRNAKIAFKQFLDGSSDEEMKCWYEATGKPWLNPRLTATEKYKARHKHDSEFHINRRLYYRDRKTKRRYFIKASNDGTLSGQVIKQAKHCLYCWVKFDCVYRKTLDHLISIKKGGLHSAANVVVCCQFCNSKKGDRDYFDWVSTLDEPHRTRAMRAWRKLRGAHVRQQVLIK